MYRRAAPMLLALMLAGSSAWAAIDPGGVTLEGSNVCIAPFNIAAGGTVIFNIIARNGAPHSVTGSIANFGSLRRLS